MAAQAAKIAQGTKLGFPASVRHLPWVSFWIITLNLISTAVISGVPLRAQPKGVAPVAARAPRAGRL